MRILLVSSATQTSRTGVTAHYNRLLTQLAGRVETIQLITPADTPVVAKKVLGGLRRVATWLGPNGRTLYQELENFVSIWVSVRQKGASAFDLVHAQDATSGAAAALGLSRKVRVVTTCHFNDDPVAEYRQRVNLSAWTTRQLSAWFRYLFQQTDAFITVSDYTKQMTASLRPERVTCTVIHNGVLFPPTAPRPDDDLLTITNIGTIEDRKNQRLLIDTADELRRRGFTRFRVRLLGDGPKRADWQTLVYARNLGDYVTFSGYQSDVMATLEQTSLYVHTARNESWGYTITEAIAAGTPVLALATGGIPEQFDAHQPGLLRAETTASELADAILHYRFPDARRQLADQQGEYARDRFRTDIMIEKHLALYRAVINRRETNYAHELLVEA